MVFALVFATLSGSVLSGSSPGSNPLVLRTGLALSAFTVNSTGDGADADTTDNVCQTATPGQCTLRAAIQQANATVALDTIGFNISGPGPHTIAPATLLPVITNPVVIDGFTQPGSLANSAGPGAPTNAVMKIELSGASAPSGFGLSLGGGSTVRGLVVNRFGLGAIQAAGFDNVIEGNYVGLDVTGSSVFENTSGSGYPTGIMLNLFSSVPTGNATVGGLTPASRNVIAGSNVGILIFNGPNTTVVGNFIGTNAAGTGGFGVAAFTGIQMLLADGNTIGGTTPAARNIISGHSFSGVEVGGGSNLVQGNYIGTTADGNAALGNGVFGVLASGPNNAIGGTVVGAGNVIANTGTQCQAFASPHCGAGVVVLDFGQPSVSNVAILGNSVYANRRLGIDLTASPDTVGDGVTTNDALDGDGGANLRQNFPVLSSASPGSTTVQGSLNSAASTTFRLEFFANPSCDSSGHGEGKTFLEARSVTTDASGNVGFNFTLSPTTANGQFITATATDPAGNTSEFSSCVEVGALSGTATRTATATPTTSLTPTLTITPTPSTSLTPTSSPTITPTPTTTGTPTLTATLTPTQTLTATVSPTSSPGGTIGGAGMRLTALLAGGVQLAWQPGTRQTGYFVYRSGDGGDALTPLPPSASGYADNPSGTFACYAVLALEGDIVLAISDVLCTVLGTGAEPAPAGVTIRLDQGFTATITWPGVQKATTYVLFVAGAPERTQVLGPGSLSATDATGGAFTCYAVVVVQETQTGWSPAVCALPGSSFGL
jgi:trimeric autotransporter adhesin